MYLYDPGFMHGAKYFSAHWKWLFTKVSDIDWLKLGLHNYGQNDNHNYFDEYIDHD